MQSRLPETGKNSQGHSTGTQRTHSMEECQLLPQQLSSRLANTADEKNHNHSQVH